MKAVAVVTLVMITAASGCSLWPDSSEDWSGSWGIHTPIVSDSIAPKRKPNPLLGAQTQCALGGQRRTLEMIRQGTGCRLSYQNKMVAQAIWGKRVCQQVRSQIVQNLRAAGYSCS